jgi:hypothetical protein
MRTARVCDICFWRGGVANWHYVPLYGDTTEYIALSKTLKVDQYRGIIYPIALRTSDIIDFHLSIKIGFLALYFAQLFLLFISPIVFCITLLKTFADGRMSDKYAIVCGLVASFNPLSFHFALAVFTDSIAASLLMLQAACLIIAMCCSLSICVVHFGGNYCGYFV